MPPAVPLVEREALLDQLAASLAAARDGTGRLVLLSGEAGAGKTALVRAALADLEARWGWCEPLTVPRPLGPFRDLVDVGDDGPVAVGERLLAELRERPSVLVVEDAHWVDDAGADVVRYLGRRIEASRGLLVVTYRDEAGPDHPLTRLLGELPVGASVVRLAVPPLTLDAVTELLDGSGRDPEEAWRVTQGNAFLVDQLADSPGPTDAVREAVAARVARLGPEARALVRTLSVVPRRVPTAALPSAVDEAVRGGLLEESRAGTGFRHELVRLAVEAGLAPHERGAAHAAALERSPTDDPAVLAFHARGAGLVERAHQLDLAAADTARRSGAHRQAAAHLRLAATDALGAPEERARLWLSLAAEERVVGHDHAAREAVDAATAAASGTADPLLPIELLQWRARLVPDDVEGERLAREVVERLRPLGLDRQLARATAALATIEMVSRQLERAVATGTEAIALAEVSGDAEALTWAQQAVGCALVLSGRDPDGRLLRDAIRTADEAGLDNEAARAHSNLVSAAGEARLYDVVAEAVPLAQIGRAHV